MPQPSVLASVSVRYGVNPFGRFAYAKCPTESPTITTRRGSGTGGGAVPPGGAVVVVTASDTLVRLLTGTEETVPAACALSPDSDARPPPSATITTMLAINPSCTRRRS